VADAVAHAGRAVRLLAALACAACLAAASPAHAARCERDEGGIGGTGNAPAGRPPVAPGKGKDRGGVGGTGHSERDDGGVGGTGVYGVITGFGSVCVNGLEIEIDGATRVESDGTPSSASALAIGQLVAIDAIERDGAIRAERIAVRSAAVGPIERVDARRGELEILGQRVQLDARTRFADAAGDPAQRTSLGAGDFVTVHGLRRGDGAVVATRIERTPVREQLSVSGPARPAGPDRLAIGGLTVVSPGRDAAQLADRLALAVGRWDPVTRELVADRIEPVVRFAVPTDRVSIEGYVVAREPRGFRTELVGVDTSALGGEPPRVEPDARVVVRGALAADGRVLAERVELALPERPDGGARRDHEHHRDERSRGDEPEHVERPPTPPTPEHVERPEAPEHPEVERPETPDHPEVERPEAPERPEVERPEAPERPEVERPEAPERPEIERPETPERPEVERPEAPERPEIERPEAPERPEIERPETPERPEVERPEAPERPEIEHPEELERPERPEHDDD
jgi:hypothetical protein